MLNMSCMGLVDTHEYIKPLALEHSLFVGM